MIFDKKIKKIKKGDSVKNLVTDKIVYIDETMELVLNHSEIFPDNDKKVWKYNHLEKEIKC